MCHILSGSQRYLNFLKNKKHSINHEHPKLLASPAIHVLSNIILKWRSYVKTSIQSFDVQVFEGWMGLFQGCSAPVLSRMRISIILFVF